MLNTIWQRQTPSRILVHHFSTNTRTIGKKKLAWTNKPPVATDAHTIIPIGYISVFRTYLMRSITKLETCLNAKASRSKSSTNRQHYHKYFSGSAITLYATEQTVLPLRTACTSERMSYTRSPVANVNETIFGSNNIRNMHDRIKEHLTKTASSVFKHLISCNNNTRTAISVKIIARDTDPVNLRLKEALHIEKEKPQISSREECNVNMLNSY